MKCIDIRLGTGSTGWSGETACSSIGEVSKMETILASGHRPSSFHQAAQWVNAGLYGFGEALAELVDELKKMDSGKLSAAMALAPATMEAANRDYDESQDAYLAAAAEHIARGAGIDIPAWTEEKHRFLRRAWFDNQGLISLNATMLKESPLAFRRRFIFTEAQPLRRA